MARPPKIIMPGRSIPAGYVMGRRSPGRGGQELVDISNLGQMLTASGVVATPGAPGSYSPIADNRFLANISGGTAAPVAHPFTDIVTLGTVTAGTWNAGTVSSHTSSSGVRPASTATAGWAITSNYLGAGETNYWNTVNSTGGADQGFGWFQKTGASSEIQYAALYGDGTFTQFDFYAGVVGATFGAQDGIDGFIGTLNAYPFDFYINNVLTVSFPVGGGIALLGATSGSVTIKVPAVAGTRTLTLPAGTTDFSATSGIVQQASSGAAFTVGTAPVAQGGTGQTRWF